MTTARGTLVTDGSGDRMLVPVLEWLLANRGRPCAITWANFATLRVRPKGFADRLHTALDLYPCTILFVHRDAEGQTIEARQGEIRAALPSSGPPHVCVVPVRMSEAWLLFDQAAIRGAAGNPNGTMPLDLPPLSEVERIPHPEVVLEHALRAACGLKGRRLARFKADRAKHLVASAILDYSPLRQLSAFQEVERQIDALPPPTAAALS